MLDTKIQIRQQVLDLMAGSRSRTKGPKIPERLFGFCADSKQNVEAVTELLTDTSLDFLLLPFRPLVLSLIRLQFDALAG